MRFDCIKFKVKKKNQKLNVTYLTKKKRLNLILVCLDYALSNEIEATKTILFKNNFSKFYSALLKRNKAEEIVLNTMNVIYIKLN